MCCGVTAGGASRSSEQLLIAMQKEQQFAFDKKHWDVFRVEVLIKPIEAVLF